VWCSGEHELYDLNVSVGNFYRTVSLRYWQNDPGQLKNLLQPNSSPTFLLGHELSKVVARLDSLLYVLKSCKAQTCIQPWQALHPAEDVNDLHDALSSRYDHFYEKEQRRVEYNRCEAGYIVDAEGPQFEKDGLVYSNEWSNWV
jgi:hypothetical protein